MVTVIMRVLPYMIYLSNSIVSASRPYRLQFIEPNLFDPKLYHPTSASLF